MSYKRASVKREFKHSDRGESARRTIGDLYPACDIMGLTKGDFSMIDILDHCLKQSGPSDIVIGTWTAAHADVTQAENMLKNGLIKSMRMLVDRSFPQRQPKYYEKVLSIFGQDSVRLARFHAKFILIKSEKYSLVIRTSMNLNKNARIEMYEITDSSEMYEFFQHIVDEHFSKPCEDSYDTFKSLKFDKSSKKPETSRNTEKSTVQQRLSGWD
jgi:hypothetical protein